MLNAPALPSASQRNADALPESEDKSSQHHKIALNAV